MANSLKDNAKYKKWLKTHHFGNCKLDRKDYGEFLSNYITGEKDGFVLNLNGSWGTGKTEFLKRLYSHMLDENHPVIYIDAWESDFSKDPLTVVTSELLSQLEKFNGGIGKLEDAKKVKELFGKVLKGTAVGLAGLTTHVLAGSASIGADVVKEIVASDPKEFTQELTKNYASQIKSIKEIRECLGQLAEVLQSTYKYSLPVVLLVDELDRCRPTYSIEMLEVIKHFFSTKNFVFVVATDTEQLCHSIKCVYGDGFESEQYLKRFFDRKISLPKPDIDQYVSLMDCPDDLSSDLYLFPREHPQDYSSVQLSIAALAKSYDLKIRGVDQLFSKTVSCLRSASEACEKLAMKQVLNVPVLILGLIEQDSNSEWYHQQAYNSKISVENFKFDALYNNMVPTRIVIIIALEAITLKQRIDKHHQIENFKYWDTINSREIRSLISQKSKEEYFNVLRSYIEFCDLHKSELFNVWLWDSYKKLIELAGTIE